MVRFRFGWHSKRRDHVIDEIIHVYSSGNARRFSYGSLHIATNNFSEDMLIGEGGSAEVYRGVLPDGTLIAVKNYKSSANKMCEWEPEQFPRMVGVISCIRHPNINQVMGYCIRNNNHPLLVSDYVDNGSLDDLILNQERRESIFKWPMRVAICIGIARGLSHLHEYVNPRAVHRDIKPANILLDANFTPKISDFDLVRFFGGNSNELPLEEAAAVAMTLDGFDSDSRFTTRVMGTWGYVDPEYFATCKCTQKSDVYAFGVVMLQIISGRRAVFCDEDGSHGVTTWALGLLQNDRVKEIIDPVLTDFPTDIVQRFIDVAFSCTKYKSKQRPSMREVMQMLDGACNSVSTSCQPFAMPTTDHTPYISAASSFRSSTCETNDEVERETELADLDAKLQPQGVTESNTTNVLEVAVHHHQLGIILSGSGDLVERLSQTMVFKKPTKLDFPEAVYPPFQTRVFRRGGSRNLYTF